MKRIAYLCPCSLISVLCAARIGRSCCITGDFAGFIRVAARCSTVASLRSCNTRVTVACGGSLEGCTSAAHKGDVQSKQESLVGIKSLMGHANRRVARRAMGQLQKTLFAQVVRVAARCSNYSSALFTSIDVSLLRSGYSEDDHTCKSEIMKSSHGPWRLKRMALAAAASSKVLGGRILQCLFVLIGVHLPNQMVQFNEESHLIHHQGC